MIRALIEQTFDSTKKYLVLFGLSTDSKPVSGLITGSEFNEVDTGVKYEFDEVNSQWHEVGITEQEIKDEIDAWLDAHPEATTTVQDGSISYAKLDSSLKGTVDDVADLKTEMEQKANVDGSYSSLTAGNAEQLVSTVGVTDKTPYLCRTTDGSADVGDRVKLSEITGGTVAWNQLVTTAQRTISVTPDGTYTHSTSPAPILTTAGHVYFIAMTVKNYNGGKTLRGYCQIYNTYGSPAQDLTGTSKTFAWICKPSKGHTAVQYGLSNLTTSDKLTSEDAWTRDDTQVFDLTVMFGSTIADYIYSLEQATPGAGTAFFRKLFPKDYYAYDAGTPLSVKTSAHKTVGFNQWDEEWEAGVISSGVPSSANNAIRSKNFCKILPDTTYYMTCGKTDGGANNKYYLGCAFYDADKTYIGVVFSNNKTFTTPSNAAFFKLTTNTSTVVYGNTYNNDICINLHWDGERDGEYEPYEEHTYPLDDVELRGIPKLDANNNLYYDGDSYAPDGTVTRRYGYVNLGSLRWNERTTGSVNVLYSASLPADYLGYNSNMAGKWIAAPYSYHGPSSASTLIGTVDSSAVGIYSYSNAGASASTIYLVLPVGTAASAAGDLVYELATSTTETADPYQETQICNDFGTEEFVDERTVPMPVGANALYQANLRAKLEMAPDSPDGDGDYIVRQTDGENTYVPLVIPTELPSNPSEDGTYSLKVTISSGTATLSWVADV